MSGREVATVLTGLVEPGRHTVRWDGHDHSGNPVPAGVYLCELRTPQGRLSQRMSIVH